MAETSFSLFAVVGAISWAPELQQHVVLSVAALLVSILIGLPVGACLTRVERASFAVISVANLGRTIPSLALLALVYPFLGTGFVPALVALVALGIPPILLAAYTGVRSVDESVTDAARGMGFTSSQRLIKVELPLSTSLIVSGARTSAVQIVASATLAALIGAGGLGEMILASLATLDYNMLLTGAALVAVLAVATELGFSLLERSLPASLRMGPGTGKRNQTSYRAGGAFSQRQWAYASVACGAVCVVLFTGGLGAASVVSGQGFGIGGDDDTVVVGSKDFTEQYVLGELYAQALEAQGFKVRRRLGLGATAVADAAVRRGDIDFYPEYTGTALMTVLKKSPPAFNEGVDIDGSVLKSITSGYGKRGVSLLEPAKLSNGFAIVMKKETAQQLKVKTLTDLAKISNTVKFGAVADFKTREDGLSLLKKRYGMDFQQIKVFENGIKYKALADGEIDAVYGFETDGRIAADGLVILTDDKHIWPPYRAVPVVNSAFLKETDAKFAPTINAVNALLDTATMQELNNQADNQNEPEDVARKFLKHHKLV